MSFRTGEKAGRGLTRIVRIGDAVMRHATWILFGLLAVALFAGSAPASHGALMLAESPAPPVSAWLTPQILAGFAAIVVALCDGVAKIVRAAKGQPEPAPAPTTPNPPARAA